MKLSTKIAKYQTIEKSGLIIGGTVLVPSGIAYLENDARIGFALIILGIACLIVRELIKLKRK